MNLPLLPLDRRLYSRMASGLRLAAPASDNTASLNTRGGLSMWVIGSALLGGLLAAAVSVGISAVHGIRK